jgi:hypothetical protein
LASDEAIDFGSGLWPGNENWFGPRPLFRFNGHKERAAPQKKAIKRPILPDSDLDVASRHVPEFLRESVKTIKPSLAASARLFAGKAGSDPSELLNPQPPTMVR